MFCWIQVTQEEAKVLEEKSIIQKGVRCKYLQPEMGRRIVEHHMDTCYLFQQRMSEETIFGQKQSVRYESG
jgi:hypothetical protein